MIIITQVWILHEIAGKKSPLVKYLTSVVLCVDLYGRSTVPVRTSNKGLLFARQKVFISHADRNKSQTSSAE